jgi:aryl-alcohol dehydrogenase-like predicted oxidoreductase
VPSTTVPTADAAAAELSPTPLGSRSPGGMPLRRLGRIDWNASVITVGGAIAVESDVVSYAVERGVNMFDTAPTYGSNMETIRPVLADHRDEIFLLSKVVNRGRSDAAATVRRSLERMGVSTIDIVLLHDVSSTGDLDQALATDGAIAALEEARDAGIIRYIGISGHTHADVLVTAFDRYDFDLVLCPVNPIDHVIDDFVSTVGAAAARTNAGFMGMKVMSAGKAPDKTAALRWALSQPAHTLTIGMANRAQVDANIDTAVDLAEPLPQQELEELVEQWRYLAARGNFYWRS